MLGGFTTSIGKILSETNWKGFLLEGGGGVIDNFVDVEDFNCIAILQMRYSTHSGQLTSSVSPSFGDHPPFSPQNTFFAASPLPQTPQQFQIMDLH